MVAIVRVANAISTTSHATISWHCWNATANLAISGLCKLTINRHLSSVVSFSTHFSCYREHCSAAIANTRMPFFVPSCRQSGGALTCQTLEKDFKCSCAGCGCKGPPKCDKKTMKVCTDAYKAPCKLGSKKAVCGACIKGYKSDGKHGCVKAPNKCKYVCVLPNVRKWLIQQNKSCHTPSPCI